jgi:hypothetical protein
MGSVGTSTVARSRNLNQGFDNFALDDVHFRDKWTFSYTGPCSSWQSPREERANRSVVRRE